jgi:hypothetical protein
MQIIKGEFKFPEGFPDGAQKLIKSILTTNPNLVRHDQKMKDLWPSCIESDNGIILLAVLCAAHHDE